MAGLAKAGKRIKEIFSTLIFGVFLQCFSSTVPQWDLLPPMKPRTGGSLTEIRIRVWEGETQKRVYTDPWSIHYEKL